MLLSTLTADELERLAYVEPDRPGVQQALAARCQRELDDAQGEIEMLERQVTELEDYNSDYDD